MRPDPIVVLVGIDVGGTFTDLAWWDGSRVSSAKVSTTPDPANGVAAALATTPGGAVVVLHGTTVATNALLERAGARTALLTDTGFEDLVEIGRQDRPSLYDLGRDRPAPLVPAGLRIAAGRRDGPIDADAVAARLEAAGAESVAVALLDAHADPSREQSVAAVLEPIGLPLSLSSTVAPEFREFERTSTTVLNAYLAPLVSRYVERLDRRIGEARLGLMRSSGGLLDAAGAAALPAALLLSGPAGGAMAAASLAAAAGWDRVIAFDMGGTSTDVCRIEHGVPELAFERAVDGYACRLPALAVHTVGAGGGSVAWVDAGGALRVGPRSAGATPGPACYGRGGRQATVTDAALGLGYLDAAGTLAGTLPLDQAAGNAAIAQVATEAGLEPRKAAAGIVEVVEATMAAALRRVSVEEGADPRRAVLIAFGGAGAMHATRLARTLDMAAVAVPPHAGVFSALGMLLSPPRVDATRSVLGLDPGAAAAARAELAAAASADLLAMTGSAPARVDTTADMRYRGQSHETSVRYGGDDDQATLVTRFHARHHERNGFSRPDDPVEMVTLRAVARGEPALTWADLPTLAPTGEARRGERTLRLAGGDAAASVWDRAALRPGAEVVGPAVIEEREATTVLHPGERARVDDAGTLLIEW